MMSTDRSDHATAEKQQHSTDEDDQDSNKLEPRRNRMFCWLVCSCPCPVEVGDDAITATNHHQEKKCVNNQDSEQSAKGSSITDLANLSLRTGKLQIGSTSTLPSEKKSGFRKWLPSSSRKKSSNSGTIGKNNNTQQMSNQQQSNGEYSNMNSGVTTSPATDSNQTNKSPTKGSKKNKGSSSRGYHVIKPSSVKHLVSGDACEEEDAPPSLPPRMQIVGSNKLATPNNSSDQMNNGDEEINYDDEDEDFHQIPLKCCTTPSLSNDLRNEMELLLTEKFPPMTSTSVVKMSGRFTNDSSSPPTTTSTQPNTADIWEKRTDALPNNTTAESQSTPTTAEESVERGEKEGSPIETSLCSPTTMVDDKLHPSNLCDDDKLHPSNLCADEQTCVVRVRTSGDGAPTEGDDDNKITTSQSQVEKAILQRSYVVQELLTTEDEYVAALETIVNQYMPKVLERGLPDPDKDQERVIFGNIQMIYEWHRSTFLKDLQKCSEDATLIGRLFKKHERRLQMYVIYCQNKPLSEYLVLKHKQPYFFDLQTEVGTKLSIADYLIKPVQRIMKYQLLLKDILKYTERSGEDCTDLKVAVDIMYVIPKLANDMMTVGRMKGFPGRINAQGKLLLQDTFLARDISTNSEKERKVFLFEQSVVLSELVDKRVEELGFVFRNHIKIADLAMDDIPSATSDSKVQHKFLLTSRRDQETFELTAPTAAVKENWMSTLQNQLDSQLDFVNALQLPILYQKQKGNANSNNNNNRKMENHRSSNSSMTSPTSITSPTTPEHHRPFLSTFRPHLNSKADGDCVTSSSLASDVTIEAVREEEESLVEEQQTVKIEERNNVATDQIHLSSTLPRKSMTTHLPISTMTSSPRHHSVRTRSSSKLLDNVTNIRTCNKQQSSAANYATSSRHPPHRSTSSSITHRSAPDLSQQCNSNGTSRNSSSSSFWLSPLSPANIKHSTCKFIYPQADNNTHQERENLLESPTSTCESRRSATMQSERQITSVVAARDFDAEKEDEISVRRGDTLQVIATNARGLFLVHRPADQDTPAAEGWIPGDVLGRAAYTLRKQPTHHRNTTPRMLKRLSAKRSTPRTESTDDVTTSGRRNSSLNGVGSSIEKLSTFDRLSIRSTPLNTSSLSNESIHENLSTTGSSVR